MALNWIELFMFHQYLILKKKILEECSAAVAANKARFTTGPAQSRFRLAASPLLALPKRWQSKAGDWRALRSKGTPLGYLYCHFIFNLFHCPFSSDCFYYYFWLVIILIKFEKKFLLMIFYKNIYNYIFNFFTIDLIIFINKMSDYYYIITHWLNQTFRNKIFQADSII